MRRNECGGCAGGHEDGGCNQGAGGEAADAADTVTAGAATAEPGANTHQQTGHDDGKRGLVYNDIQ